MADTNPTFSVSFKLLPSMTSFDFRNYQALSDLHQVHKFLGPASIYPITQNNNALFKELTLFLKDPSQYSGMCFSQAMNDALWLAAVSPETNPDAVLTAASVLIMASLSNKDSAQDLSWLWEEYKDIYRAATPPVRAALMNGFKRLRHSRLLPDDCKPSEEDLLTRALSDVEEILIPIARSMTSAEIESVAAADYGMDLEKHMGALTDLLDSPTLAYPPGERWFPAEVVELTSHVQGRTGWLPCSAIMLLDAVRTLDNRSNAEFRFESQWRDYRRLPARERAAFHAALRYLYESDAFNPQFPNYHCFDTDNDVSLCWNEWP
ncbi:hypothetical protein N6L27_17710 [Leisingera sp. SS27]|uniref:hypothetical protein n=1 Tax=Leisingera sp. SS27 TaxID=2979462 RepID=UPI00232C9B25|nr:hypothetical protein [Leisingera sp. SS27]MDC0659840.1 hypothetical protein [Leisingera sp. SS27]